MARKLAVLAWIGLMIWFATFAVVYDATMHDREIKQLENVG